MSNLIDNSSPFGTHPKKFFAKIFYMLISIISRLGWPGRKVIGLLRRAGPLTSKETIIDVKRFGLRWRLYPHDNFGEAVVLLKSNSWERKSQDWILDRIDSDFFFIDVGANCGVYALRASRKMRHGKVIVIEPSPTVLERLRFNAKLNAGYPVTVLGCAVGQSAGTVGFSEARNLDQSHMSCDGSIKVEMRTLSEIIEAEGFERLDAVKVDVEGYEDRVLGPFLREAPESLLPGIIVAEYTLRDLWEMDWIAQAAIRGYREQDRCSMNILLVKG